jgi:hypothetical protein
MRQFLPSILWIATAAWASSGNSVGNGGDVVVCRDAQNRISSVEVYDIVEAAKLRNLPMDIRPAGRIFLRDWDQKITVPLERLRRLSPLRAAEYAKQAQTFLENSRFVRNVDLTDIPDSDHALVPRGCHIEQIVIRKDPTFVDDRLYLVNEDLWEKLDEENKAILVMHELIYGEALAYGATDSRAARYLNSLIFSKRIDVMTQKDWFDALKRSNFHRSDYLGLWLIVDEKTEFFEAGGIRNARVTEKQPIAWGTAEQAQITGFAAGQIAFDESGTVRELQFCGSYRNQYFELRSLFCDWAGTLSTLQLYESGLRVQSFTQGQILGWPDDHLNPLLSEMRFKTINFSPAQKILNINIDSAAIRVPMKVEQALEAKNVLVAGELSFYESGLLRSGIIREPIEFKSRQYELQTIPGSFCRYTVSEAGQILAGISSYYFLCFKGWVDVEGQRLQGSFSSSQEQFVQEVILDEGKEVSWNIYGNAITVSHLQFDATMKVAGFRPAFPKKKVMFPIQGTLRKISFATKYELMVRFHPGTQILQRFIAEEPFPLKLRDQTTTIVKRGDVITLSKDGYP